MERGSCLHERIVFGADSNVNFDDFHGDIDIAMSSKEIFQCMRNWAQESPSDEQLLLVLLEGPL